MSIWTDLLFVGGYVATPSALAAAQDPVAAASRAGAPVAIAATEVAAVGVAVGQRAQVRRRAW